jgi:hypothetical protein
MNAQRVATMNDWDNRSWTEQCALLDRAAAGSNPFGQWDGFYVRFSEQLRGEIDLFVLEPDGDPVRFAVQLQDAIARIIAIAVEATTCDDSWYPTVTWGVRWLCEARGLPLDDAQRKQLSTIVNSCFESWIVNESQTLQANDAITELLVRGPFEARYRSST